MSAVIAFPPIRSVASNSRSSISAVGTVVQRPCSAQPGDADTDDRDSARRLL